MATLKCLDNLLHDPIHNTYRHIQDPTPAKTTTVHPPPSNPTPLTTALTALTQAIALYNRSGPLYRSRTEIFWIFAAGSWSRQQYDEAVREAAKKLGRARSVEEDLRSARGLVREAVEVLRRAEMRDVADLEEAWRGFEGGGL